VVLQLHVSALYSFHNLHSCSPKLLVGALHHTRILLLMLTAFAGSGGKAVTNSSSLPHMLRRQRRTVPVPVEPLPKHSHTLKSYSRRSFFGESEEQGRVLVRIVSLLIAIGGTLITALLLGIISGRWMYVIAAEDARQWTDPY